MKYGDKNMEDAQSMATLSRCAVSTWRTVGNESLSRLKHIFVNSLFG